MTLDDYMLTAFCLVDDPLPALHLDHVRQRGIAPLRCDSEVLTIEWSGSWRRPQATSASVTTTTGRHR